MSYEKHNFQSGSRLYASQLNEMDDQITANSFEIEKIKKPSGNVTFSTSHGKYVSIIDGGVYSHAKYSIIDKIKIPNGTKRIIIPVGTFHPEGQGGWAIYSTNVGSSTSAFVRGGRTYIVDIADSEGSYYFSCTIYDTLQNIDEYTLTFLSEVSESEVTAKDVLDVMEYAKNIANTVTKTEHNLVTGRYVNCETGVNGNASNYSLVDKAKIPKSAKRILLKKGSFIESGVAGWALYVDNVFVRGGKTYVIDITEEEAENGYISTSLYDKPHAYSTLEIEYIHGTSGTKILEHKNDILMLKTETKPLNGCNIVMLGDSIIGNFNGSDSIPSLLSTMTGASCYNCGFGGSSMGHDTVEPVYNELEAFNGFKIANCIATGDFSTLRNAINSDPTYDKLKEYFTSHVNTLESLDFNNIDIITLSYGTNDYGTRVDLDNSSDKYDTDTFGGAYRTALETLFTAFPSIKIVICSPIWRGTNTTVSPIKEGDTDFRKAYLKEYVAKCEEIAKEYHVPYLDMYSTNFNKFTYAGLFGDAEHATHPNAKGMLIMAKRYAWFLKQM